MSANLNFVSYDRNEKVNGVKFDTIEEIKSVVVGYDGGRLVVYINDKIAFTTYLAGNDCSVAVEINTKSK